MNIRPFDLVIITDVKGILNQKGGDGHSGRWSVVSSDGNFFVLSRGGRILRVKPEAVAVVGSFSTDVKIDTGIELDENCYG